MLNSYIDFEITFQQRENGMLNFQAESGTGGEVRGELPDSFPDGETQALLRRLQQDDTDEDMLIELGKRLYEALFSNLEVRRLFAFTQGSQGEEKGIRLKLRTSQGDTEVAALPWEYLYDPSRDNPFVLLDISVVRYPQLAVRIPNLEVKLPLKVLLSAAQPSDLGATYADRELEAIRAALHERGLGADQIEIVEERHLTRVKFQRLLRQGFHVWHFAGHGGFSRDGKNGVLFFEDASGAKDAVSARDLNVLLSNSGVRMIVLDACQSGALATAPFRSVAPALIASGIPAVIAMQFKVPEEATTAFSGVFYEALSEGLPVDACVTEGRKAVVGITGLRSAEWGTPVVYTRAPDGVLFKLPQKPPVQVAETKPQAGVVNDFSNSNINGGVVINTGDTNISGNTFNSGAASELDEATREALQERLNIKKRSYQMLMIQAAKYGYALPAHISLEIEDIVRDVRKLEQQLGLPTDPLIHKPY